MIRMFILSLLMMIGLYGCTSSLNDNYSGYLYFNNEPVKMANIKEINSNNTTSTDEKGYFFLKRSNLTAINNLIVHDIAAVSEKKYIFVGNKVDTLDLYRERVFKKQSENK